MVVSQGKRDVTNLLAGLYLGIGSSIIVSIWVELWQMKFFSEPTPDEVSNWFWVMTAIIAILLGAILLYFSGLLKEVRASTAQSTGKVTPMNDFDSIVSKYKGKLEKPKIEEALRIMLEKKNEIQMTSYSSTYTALFGVGVLLFGFVTDLRSSDPLLWLWLIGVAGVWIILNSSLTYLIRNKGDIKTELFEQYIEAIIKLKEKDS